MTVSNDAGDEKGKLHSQQNIAPRIFAAKEPEAKICVSATRAILPRWPKHVVESPAAPRTSAPRPCHVALSRQSLMLIDTHCHLDFPDFAPELAETIARAKARGVGRMITISTHLSRFERVKAVAEA